MANYRIPGPLGMDHSDQLPIDPVTRQPLRIPGPLGSDCEYQLKQQLKIKLEKKEIALDISQFALDITGIFDPTPASDGTNVLISLSRGRWVDAAISAVSIVPYAGDFAKYGKLPSYLKSIKKAIRIAQNDFHWSNALKRVFIPLKKVIDQFYELGANQLPPHASKTLHQIKREIDHFLKPVSSGTTANQTVGEFIANSSKNSSPKVKQSANTPSKSKQTKIEAKPKKGVSSEKESGIIDGDGGKNLSNKNQKLFDDIYAKAPDAKLEIDGLADEIASSVNGKVAKAPIKSKDRATEKIINDYNGDPSKIKDLARNTIITSDKNIDSVVTQLREKGANVKIIDGKADELGYSGVNTTIKTNTGLTGEIQVNTPEMIYAKEPESMARVLMGDDAYNAISSKTNVPGGQGHKFYEQWRKLNPDTQEAKSIASQSKAYYDSIRGVTDAN